MSLEKYKKINNNTILKALKSYKSRIKSVLEHEITHLLNAARQRGSRQERPENVIKRRGEKNDAIVYANSTEEIQARMIQILQTVIKALKQPQKTHVPSGMKKQIGLIALEINDRNIKNIIKYLLSIYEHFYPMYWKHTRKEQKRRIINRFYAMANQFVQNKEQYAAVRRLNK